MRSMLRVRACQPQRRGQLNNQMTCRALDARRFMRLHAVLSESVSQEFSGLSQFETLRDTEASRCRVAKSGVENERDAARQAGAPAGGTLSVLAGGIALRRIRAVLPRAERVRMRRLALPPFEGGNCRQVFCRERADGNTRRRLGQ